MRIDQTLVLFTALLMAVPAGAQTKLELQEQCGRPASEYTIPVGDHPGHAFRIQQTDCTPDASVRIAGEPIKAHKATGFTEMDAGEGRHQWFHVFAMDNGDSIYARSEGTADYQGRRFSSSTSQWKFVGGTGKFEKLTGTGSYTCRPGPSGFACEATGSYSVPSN